MMVTHINIVTPTRCLVQIRPRVHEQSILGRCRVTGAHIKRRSVRPRHIRVRPCHGVSRERKGSIGILRGIEPSRKRPLRLVRRILNIHIERIRGPRTGVVDKLAVNDAELPCRLIAVHERGAGSSRGEGLQVAVEVRSLDTANPVPA